MYGARHGMARQRLQSASSSCEAFDVAFGLVSKSVSKSAWADVKTALEQENTAQLKHQRNYALCDNSNKTQERLKS